MGARKAIMATVVLVMLGYLIMWIIMPTNLYRYNWTPKIKAKMTSTYFGTQAQSILIYTFPMILVAVLGSVYLHLGKQPHGEYGVIRNAKKSSKMAIWRRPVIVKGPLGIVTGIELSFLIMFVALLAWSLSTFLHVGYGRLAPDVGEKRWLAKWEATVFRLGLTGNICLALLFYPVTRGSTILQMFGLTSEASIKYHMWLGNTLMAFFTCHGLGYLLFWAVSGQISEALKWEKVGVSNVAGEIALLSGLILWIATFPRIRRKMFEVFFYTHHLYIIFMLFFFLHVGISYAFYMLPGIYLFIIDRYLRFLQSRQRVRLLSARVLSCQAIELNFAKNPSLSYNPTSNIFINIPAVSKLQWHPFTITSSSNLESDRLSVMIKVGGNWSRKLYDVVSSSSVDRLEVSVEGPYGPASNHFLRYETLVMVCGGSGITPFISIIRDLLYASSTLKSQMPKVLLISSFKNSSELSILNLLLPLSSTSYDISRLDLQIKAYVTKQKHESLDHLTQPQCTWFKPHVSDAPISPSVGQNGHLWLGAIIASSFISFLIFMGILTRYVIYPIDHNTNKIFSTAERTILYLLILCICIAITSSFAVVWNKKSNGTETKQIVNLEGVTPQATPGSQYYNADRELESLPLQSVFESTEVHYGERPNLKRLLFDLKESNVGVLACGPKGLRHEVAAICGSGLADNLHFESISFTW
ncbi:ferric reduction oxidase 2-like [Silene latifolia]|uniref:ferric reduction oxidase 2-like n=1 Tax=Silene latifolia TaxID=37657 RepID=UPI003D776327